MSAHLTAETSDRGLHYLPPLPAINGAVVAVWDSSLADPPAIWLEIRKPDISVTQLLDLDKARQLAEQIVWLCDNHYQVTNSPVGEQ